MDIFEKVFEYFELLSSVPHGSGNTKKISDICVEFAKEHKFEYYQDELNNVIIKKPGTVGYENHKPVIIQGHLDMVCAKTENTRIDMSVQPITVLRDENYIFADETTLGADDGIAVAMALAVLDSDTLKHPPIEAVFTVDEETGMYGAAGIDASKIEGRMLINIDSEEEGIFTCGCAGGCRINAELPVKRLFDNSRKVISDDIYKYRYYNVVLDGLIGGHSGCDIDKHRVCANHCLGSVLHDINSDIQVYICHINGGKFDNVISEKASACVAVERDSSEAFLDALQSFEDKLKEEYEQDDPGISLKATEIPETELTFTHVPLDGESSNHILDMIYFFPQGIRRMSESIPGLVETSANLGVIRLEKNIFRFSCSVRSSIKERKNEVIEEICDLVDILGGTSKTGGDYPGWEYKDTSELRKICVDAYKKQYNEEPEIEVIHAGLECGLFMDKLEGLDAISFGPDIFDIHTPNEKLSIASAKRVFSMLCGILESL